MNPGPDRDAFAKVSGAGSPGAPDGGSQSGFSITSNSRSSRVGRPKRGLP